MAPSPAAAAVILALLCLWTPARVAAEAPAGGSCSSCPDAATRAICDHLQAGLAAAGSSTSTRATTQYHRPHPHHGSEEEEEQQEPWYHHPQRHEHAFDKPRHAHAQHPYRRETDEPHHSYPDTDGSGGSYYPWQPDEHPHTPIPVYPTASATAQVEVTLGADTPANATGSLPPPAVTTSAFVDRIGALSTDPNQQSPTAPGVYISQRFFCLSNPAPLFSVVGPVSHPTSFKLRCDMSPEFAFIQVTHGKQQPRFWQEAASTTVNVPEPASAVYYPLQPNGLPFDDQGVFDATHLFEIESPAPFSGSVTQLLTEALLGKTSGQSSFVVNGTDLQPMGDGMWKPAQTVAGAAAAGQHPAVDARAHVFRQHNKHDRRSRDDSYYGGYGPHHPPVEPPVPDIQLQAAASNELELSVTGDLVNVTGPVEQGDMETFTTYLRSSAELGPADPATFTPRIVCSRRFEQVDSVTLHFEGPVQRPRSLTMKTNMVLTDVQVSTTARFPWAESQAYQVVIAQTAYCGYIFTSVGDVPETAFYQGTAKFKVSPVGYSGTFLDLVIGAFTPKPYGPQEVEVTCTFPQNA